MKKIAITLLVLLGLFGLTGCLGCQPKVATDAINGKLPQPTHVECD